MTKAHDFTGLAIDVIAKMRANAVVDKNSRTTRTSRTIFDKPLSHGHNFGTSKSQWSVRPEKDSYQTNTTSRTQIDESNHQLGDGGTTVTTGTSYIQQRRAPTLAPGSVAEWYVILDELTAVDPPDWASPVRWQIMLSDADAFLSRWGDAADQLGWTALDLFGVHPNAPADRYDVMGLLLVVQGGDVVALTAETATIRRPSNAVLTYSRANATGGILVTEASR